MEKEKIIFDSEYQSMLNRKYWDFRAKDYNESASKRIEPDKEKQDLIQFFLEQKILTSQSRVLDLGCGPGWFTREFANVVQEVVGVDISEEMLRYAKENNRAHNNVSFHQLDWSTEDVDALGSFDLVFANMAPAVYDVMTLKKMIGVCRGYCYYSHFASRTHNLGDALDRLFGVSKEKNRIPNMFRALWEMGHFPTVNYVDKQGGDAITPEYAMTYYRKEYGFSAEDEDKVKQIFHEHTKDGMIQRLHSFKKGILLWKVKESY